MLAQIPSPLWEEWIAFFDLEPFGGVHEDLRFGKLCSLLSALIGNPKSPAEHFPTLRGIKPPRQTPQQAAEIMKRMCMAYGGTVNGGNDQSSVRPPAL